MFENKGNIQSVVLLRGIAALGVCFMHFFIINQTPYSPLIITRLFMMGQLGVPIFFVISGFILPYSLFKKQYVLKAFPAFLLKRIIRIEPPYWATILLLIIVGLVPLADINLTGVVLHITYLVPLFNNYKWFSGVFWTLAIEFQYYILLGLCFPLLMRLKPKQSVIVVVLISVVLILVRLSIKELFFSSMYDFAVGYIVFQYFANRISLKFTIGVLILFCVFIGFYISILTGLVPASAALTILLLDKKLPKAILLLGNISYSLYLTHSITMNLYLRFIKTYVSNQAVLCSSSILLSILFAYGFYLLFEKPALNFSKKVRLARGINR